MITATAAAGLIGGALIAWIWLPRWQPDWVVVHSPWMDPRLRAEAARHPQWIGSSWDFTRIIVNNFGPGTFAALRRGAKHRDPNVRGAAIGGLGALFAAGHDDPASRALLRECAVSDAIADVRVEALKALLVSSSEDESVVLVQAIIDDHQEMRAQAAEAMKAHPHDHHLPLLITAAADSHMYVRLAAIGTLESHNGTQADDALFRALDDPFRQAASEAAIVLMRRPALAPDRRRQVLKRLITDLHDDYVPGNAGIALKALSPQKSPDVDTALMGLLESPDRQARHLAAYLLNEHDAPPTTALVRVSIAALAKDGFSPIGPDTTIANASSSLRWLARQKEIDDLLIAALTASRDPQQRFCCALILALHRRSDQVVLIAPVLIPHLQDNYIERDAAFAMRGLFVLGPAVTPWLDRAAPRADAQARRLIAQILGNLRNPPADQAAARRGSTVKELFTYAEDPSWENAYEDLLWIDNEDHW